MIPVFERAKTVHFLDRAATVMGEVVNDHLIFSSGQVHVMLQSTRVNLILRSN
jgi:hypothetical protein